jgi:hypothetical protein
VSVQPISGPTVTLRALQERRRERDEKRSSRRPPGLEPGVLGETIGSTVPRIWTPPLVSELTPETSVGFDQIDFARDVLRRPLDPWQEWAAIHAGELLPDGRPRFRIVLILVARQNGKTELPVIISAYWLFVDKVDMIMGTSTKLDYARETWDKTRRLIRRAGNQNDDLRRRLQRKSNGAPAWHRLTNGEQELWIEQDDDDGRLTGEVSRYKIAAANEEGGRSLTVERLIADELRQHHNYSAWNAAEPTTQAVEDGQIWALSNAGDDRSVVLNDLRQQAITFIETGNGDFRLGIMEWSSPEGSDPTDLEALKQANPNLGRRQDPETLLAQARAAVAAGGEALTGFRTEKMCIRVPMLNPAVDPDAWHRGLIPGNLAMLRARVALVVDLSPDGQHASLVAAAVLPDGRVRVEEAHAWSGLEASKLMRRELPDVVRRVKPQVFGWFPNGPAAAVTASLRRDPTNPRRGKLLPANVVSVEIAAEVSAVCMGFAEQVRTGEIVHSGQPLLDAHVLGAEMLFMGDTWRFARKGAGHCDAAYAAAGAVHLARTLPAPMGRPRVVVVTS